MVASAERAGDDATNQRSADSQEQSQRHADPLRSRQHEPREDADNEADEDETRIWTAFLVSRATTNHSTISTGGVSAASPLPAFDQTLQRAQELRG